MDERPEPGTFVQWKGTDICMDWWCACGTGQHVDGYGVYAVRCVYCAREWALSPRLRLVPNVAGQSLEPDGAAAPYALVVPNPPGEAVVGDPTDYEIEE